MTWKSRTKTDLIIEVWEKLDCENVGAREIEAIEAVVADTYGEKAVDSPMVIARLLADEGAELRHSEIMNLYVARVSKRSYDAALRNIVKLDSLRSALTSIRHLENLRKKFAGADDKHGLRFVRETAIRAKNDALENAKNASEGIDKLINTEVADWITIWLQTPEMFETWVEMRQRSQDFVEKFGESRPGEN
jgi:hypothetical protein